VALALQRRELGAVRKLDVRLTDGSPSLVELLGRKPVFSREGQSVGHTYRCALG
jgi:hypothetical protein